MVQNSSYNRCSTFDNRPYASLNIYELGLKMPIPPNGVVDGGILAFFSQMHSFSRREFDRINEADPHSFPSFV